MDAVGPLKNEFSDRENKKMTNPSYWIMVSYYHYQRVFVGKNGESSGDIVIRMSDQDAFSANNEANVDDSKYDLEVNNASNFQIEKSIVGRKKEKRALQVADKDSHDHAHSDSCDDKQYEVLNKK